MKVSAPFGFVTGCHAGDKFMVKATLASMRYYCPNVPICLTVDGNFDVSDLEKEYDLIILRVPDLSSAEMRKVLSGSFHAKLAVMWEGPFEFYVWMDSDAIVWGDFTLQVRRDVDFQIFWDEISIPADATEFYPWLPHFYLNPDMLRKYDPNFRWQGNAYFCSGAFAARRNAISFQKYCKIERLAREIPGLFAWGEMGMLNYLIHSMAQHGELKTAMSDLQDLPARKKQSKDELEQDCVRSGWHFPKSIKRPRVVHFCGRKPYLFDRKAYSRPFTIARLEHYRKSRSELGAWSAIAVDDARILYCKIRRRVSSLGKSYVIPVNKN